MGELTSGMRLLWKRQTAPFLVHIWLTSKPLSRTSCARKKHVHC